MEKPKLEELKVFAYEKICADDYPENVHVYVEAECVNCGLVPFRVTVEHWNGDSPVAFHGIIRLQCSACGREKDYLSVLEDGGKPNYFEQRKCKCDNPTFYIASCDRMERVEDANVFSEGVVVGKCSNCGALQVIAMTG
ncbi:MAG: hypothetical protein KIH08_10565 [Candidatus Freyarchaeota archaeon]|nr:hypothetical protein [Candidatus Jordarchaeia archaeon]MBS7269649.1 hypothetical protein [Candidatus Jordarchaeia archaeon]MBS7280382.1 hypothetical protein [Candidatus Jordarchaeia archaeon]